MGGARLGAGVYRSAVLRARRRQHARRPRRGSGPGRAPLKLIVQAQSVFREPEDQSAIYSARNRSWLIASLPRCSSHCKVRATSPPRPWCIQASDLRLWPSLAPVPEAKAFTSVGGWGVAEHLAMYRPASDCCLDEGVLNRTIPFILRPSLQRSEQS